MNNPYQEPVNPYLQQLEDELQQERSRNVGLTNNQMAMMNMPNEDNLIRWQLDLKEDMEKLYHLLRGDVQHEDERGNIDYIAPDNDELKPFNDFGVQILMNIMSFYLNRNTLLSNYDEETIKFKVLDFGFEVSDLILCRYKDMMLTTTFEKQFKNEYGLDCTKLPNGRYGVYIKNQLQQEQFLFLDEEVIEHINSKIATHLQNKVELYPMIILELCDTVHSAYLRAFDGGERESLRTARVVNQSESLGNQMQRGGNVPNKKFSLMKPNTWI